VRLLIAPLLFGAVGCAAVHNGKAATQPDPGFSVRATNPRYRQAPPAPPVNVAPSRPPVSPPR
jgi:hypothetical protein